jgi:hypothetical protein
MNIEDIEVSEEELENVVESVEETEETKEEVGSEKRELVIEKKVQALANIENFVIREEADLKEAAEWLRKNKETQKIVKDFFEPEREATYKAYKNVTDKIKRFNDILSRSERIIKRKMADYRMEQERIRREAERKAEIAAEEERRKAEEARMRLREKGANGESEELESELTDITLTENIAANMAERAPEEKLDGVVFIENWVFKVEDITKVPIEYLMLDEKKVRGIVKAMKGDTNIPGIHVYAEKTVRAR